MGWNQNKGETVAIRLRRVHDTSSFFDFNHVLGTVCRQTTRSPRRYQCVGI